MHLIGIFGNSPAFQCTVYGRICGLTRIKELLWIVIVLFMSKSTEKAAIILMLYW